MISSLLMLVGSLAIGFALIVLGRLSRRLGNVTGSRKRFRWFYVAALLVGIGATTRYYIQTVLQAMPEAPSAKVVYTIISDGFPAIGITLGLVVTWYYWSWLLAECD
ncbi:MAG: hypothetical protein KC496_11885 [Anaerolineae bacterium]|nr:hypothetical protein [Anaerolineae bacterium]